MNTRMIAVAGLLGFGCDGCDSLPTALFALTSDPACEDLSCPLAVGAETSVVVQFEGQVSEVVVTPPELATVAFDAETGMLQVRPKLVGAGKIVVRAGTGLVLVQDITTAEVHTTTIEPRAQLRLWDRWLEVYPEGTTELYQSTMMRIVATHRDIDGRSLLGHGLESWSIEGGSFRGATPPRSELSRDRELIDAALVRDVLDDGSSEVRVAVRDDVPPFVLGVHPAGSADVLALEGIESALDIDEDAELRPHVFVFDRDGRYIYGAPAGGQLEIVVDDPGILTASPIADRRSVFLRGARSGRTALTIRFDGREMLVPVRVR